MTDWDSCQVAGQEYVNLLHSTLNIRKNSLQFETLLFCYERVRKLLVSLTQRTIDARE